MCQPMQWTGQSYSTWYLVKISIDNSKSQVNTTDLCEDNRKYDPPPVLVPNKKFECSIGVHLSPGTKKREQENCIQKVKSATCIKYLWPASVKRTIFKYRRDQRNISYLTTINYSQKSPNCIQTIYEIGKGPLFFHLISWNSRTKKHNKKEQEILPRLSWKVLAGIPIRSRSVNRKLTTKHG